MHLLKENIERKLNHTLEDRRSRRFVKPLEADERINECFEFDLGHYPLTPWINNNSDDKLVKSMKKYTFFLPPKPSAEIFVVSSGECSPMFEFSPILEPQLLRDSGLRIEDFEACI